MIDKIKKVFETENGKAFIPFITAGDPDAESTVKFVLEMERAGADMIELGIPFSDPTAEGVVIQEANIRALKGGMTTDTAFGIVEKIRAQSEIPLAFMTYINPVFHYGYERFFAKCEELNVGAIILPDCPYEESGELKDIAESHNVAVVTMISPTSDDRIRRVAKDAKGFIYVVSSMGVTGVRTEFNTDLDKIVTALKNETDVPCAIGFGISTPEQAKRMASISDGAIVGSAIVRIVAEHGRDAAPYIYEFVKSMKDAVAEA
ncbi:MAG: tryptophan synthase subunit alpha [Lachnospiraceae bacterium]|nr:tryptophan synthase subunit alpha [Lachnospiraceae bacterium]